MLSHEEMFNDEKLLGMELRKKIEELENLRLKRYLLVERKMLEAVRAGGSVDPKFIDLSGMKEIP